MDAAGLALGVVGISPLVGPACEAWRAIQTANNFGVDMTDWFRKAEIEFFRFHTWWDVLQDFEG